MSQTGVFRLRLFLSIWLTLVVHWNDQHDAFPRYLYLVRALAEHGTTQLESVAPRRRDDILERDGHLRCNNNPGVSYVAAPAWFVAKRLARGRAPVLQDALAHVVSFAVTSAAAVAGTALLLAVLVERRSTRARGVLAALLYAFGSVAFHFGTHLNQNVVIAFLGFLSWCAVAAPDVLGRAAPAPVIAGLACGLGVFVDLSIAPLGATLVLLLARSEAPRRSLLAFGAACVPGAIALCAYLHVAFGDPWHPPQFHYAVEDRVGIGSRFEPSLARLLDQTVLPTHGFVPFMPFALLALLGIVRTVRRTDAVLPARELVPVLAPVVAYLGYVFVTFDAKFSQFGPRYLIPAVPFVVLLAALAWRERDAWFAVPLVLASFFVNVAGAQLGVGTGNVATTVALYSVRGPWLPLLDWLQTPAVREVVTPPRVVTPQGPLLALAILQGAIWGPAVVRRASPP